MSEKDPLELQAFQATGTIQKQAIAYMHSRMGMPETSTDQEQNWILGHLVTFAMSISRSRKSICRKCVCGHSSQNHLGTHCRFCECRKFTAVEQL